MGANKSHGRFALVQKNNLGAKINTDVVVLTAEFRFTLPTMRAISGHLKKPGKHLNMTDLPLVRLTLKHCTLAMELGNKLVWKLTSDTYTSATGFYCRSGLPKLFSGIAESGS